MADSPTSPAEPLQYRFEPPALHSLVLQRRPPPDTSDATAVNVEPALNLRFSLVRLGSNKVGYELGVRVEFGDLMEIETTMRSEFTFEGGGDGEEREKAMRDVLARNAPAALYPYAREVVQNTLIRAVPMPLALPVVNFGSLWDGESLELPPWNEEADG